jgi:hypothetical protein
MLFEPTPTWVDQRAGHIFEQGREDARKTGATVVLVIDSICAGCCSRDGCGDHLAGLRW